MRIGFHPACSVWHGFRMNDLSLGATNLAEFLAATAGRKGVVARVRGGLAVAGPSAVANAYVDGAVPTDSTVSPAVFLNDVTAFYAEQARAFVVWAPASSPALIEEAVRQGGVLDPDRPPAMSIHEPIALATDLRVSPVTTAAEGAAFGDLAERGYALPGMGWLLGEHDSYQAPNVTWVLVADEHQPLGVACGFLSGESGGLYYVATPPEHRGRGVAAAATARLTNLLLDQGARTVVLQASVPGLPIYQRLGYRIYEEYQRFTFASPSG